MQDGLTYASMLALAGVMFAGAAIPSTSVLVVSARSAALGLAHGVFTTLGIVAGDIMFILVAIYGLALLAELMGSQFVCIKYLGAAYLIWLGVMLWRARAKSDAQQASRSSSALASFMTGLLITLGDQKAILFYLGFLPAFVDLTTISLMQTGMILVIAVFAVGTPKLVYAVLAERAGRWMKGSRVASVMNKLAGSVMIGVGLVLLVRIK